MSTEANVSERRVCPLTVDDLEPVVAIDRVHSGRSRRSFFEKRFAAAQAHPDDFIHVGVSQDGALRGFATARILRGEFGRTGSIAVLDGLGVSVDSQERGVGQTLMTELINGLRRLGVQSLQSQAEWTNHQLLRFFDAAGFELAPRLALERSVTAPLDEAYEDV